MWGEKKTLDLSRQRSCMQYTTFGGGEAAVGGGRWAGAVGVGDVRLNGSTLNDWSGASCAERESRLGFGGDDSSGLRFS